VEFAEKRNPRYTARNGCATRLPMTERQDAGIEILRTILVGSPQDDTLSSSSVKLWRQGGAGVGDVGDFLVEEVDTIGAANAEVGVAGEEEKAATVAKLRDSAIVFTGGVEEKITAGIGVATADVLEERRVHEIPPFDLVIEDRVVFGREDAEVHWIFGLIIHGGLDLDLRGNGGRFLADGFESLASVGGLEEAGGGVELRRGPERRRRGWKRKSEGDFFISGERLPTDEKVCGAEGLVLHREEDALIFGIGKDRNAVECNGIGNELAERLSLRFVFWSSGNGVGAVFGFDGFGLIVGDQCEVTGRDTTDLIARRERKRAIVDLVDGNFFWIIEGNPAGFAFDFIEERDGKRSLGLGEK